MQCIVCRRYTLAGDISMLKVALHDNDEQYLNPIRMIVDETVAATGERRRPSVEETI